MSEEFRVRMMEREAGAPEQVPPLLIERWMKTKPNPSKSKAAGHPVHDDCPWIRITTPGDKNSYVERPATDIDNTRFPKSHAALMSAVKPSDTEGMPIEDWPQITRGQAETLKSLSIPTVEALAAVNDANIMNLGQPGRELRIKAQAFLAVSKDTAAAQQFKLENEQLKATLADQQRQIRELAAKLERREEPKRGPGRPRKIQDVA
jgi:hypothetical protein